MSEVKIYITSDDKEFKTGQNMDEVDSREYPLDLLIKAESRVIRGTNKSIRKALNSLGTLKYSSDKNTKKKKSMNVPLKDVVFDKYGLNPDIYSENQIEFILHKIKEYEGTYDSSEPFAKETILEMAKNRLKTREIESKMISTEDPSYIKQKIELRKDFASMASDLKIQPKQQNVNEKSKHRNSFAEMVLAYEARKKAGKSEWTEKTTEIEGRMDRLAVESMDVKYVGDDNEYKGG